MIGMLDFRSFVLLPKVSEALLIFFPQSVFALLFRLGYIDYFSQDSPIFWGALSILLLSSSIKIFVSTIVFSVLKFSFVFIIDVFCFSA